VIRPEECVVGALVRFGDQGVVAQNEPGAVLASGRVNGEVVVESEERWWVPVWCSRDNGRESTTVWVASVNVVQVQGPDNNEAKGGAA
jgi:hypothetical protein